MLKIKFIQKRAICRLDMRRIEFKWYPLCQINDIKIIIFLFLNCYDFIALRKTTFHPRAGQSLYNAKQEAKYQYTGINQHLFDKPIMILIECNQFYSGLPTISLEINLTLHVFSQRLWLFRSKDLYTIFHAYVYLSLQITLV